MAVEWGWAGKIIYCIGPLVRAGGRAPSLGAGARQSQIGRVSWQRKRVGKTIEKLAVTTLEHRAGMGKLASVSSGRKGEVSAGLRFLEVQVPV